MRKILIILFLTLNSVLSATDYYVKNSGNDSNSGLDDANAWAHHPWMSTWTGSVVLAPGDIVFLKKGNIWSINNPITPFMTILQSGKAGNPIITSAYGNGDKPIIKIATATDESVIYASAKSYLIFDNLHIQHHGGTYVVNRNGFYMTDVCHDVSFTNNEIDNIPDVAIFGYKNCFNIIVGDTTAINTASTTAYSNHIHDFGYAGVLLEGVNPEDNKSNFCVYFNYIHDATRTSSYNNEYGISFTCHQASMAWPNHAIARYNRIENIKTWTSVSCHGGSYIYFVDNYIKNFGRSGISFQATEGLGDLPAVLDNVYVERNTIEQSPSEYIEGAENGFITTTTGTTGIDGTNLYIRDNKIFYSNRPASALPFKGIGVAGVDGLIISGNEISDGPTVSGQAAILLSGDTGYSNKNISITNNYIKLWSNGIDLEGETITGSILITDNIVGAGAGNACLRITSNPITSTGIVKVYNNVFMMGTNAFNFYTEYGIAVGSSFIAKNNIFDWEAARSNGYYWYWRGALDGTFICDYNIYHNSTHTDPFFCNGESRNWAYWTETLGYDKHSPNTTTNLDPLFVNGSGSFSTSLDYVLQVTSPAINKGTIVDEVTHDFFGNPLDFEPDIGAYEQYFLDQTVAVAEITVTGVGGTTTIATANSTLQLVAAIAPSNATNKTVTWSIYNDTGQASISTSGVVTAIVNGTVTAKATANDGSGVYGTLLITIFNQVIPVTGITVTGAGGATTITADNGTLQLAAAVTPSNATNKTVKWSISNGTGQASISGTGLVTGITNGTITAKATANDGSGVNGTLVISISNQIIPEDPVYISSVIQNATPSVLEINYNILLANIVPAVSAFTVTVNSKLRAVNSVSVSGTKVLLTISSQIFYNDIIKITYNVSSSNKLQSTTGGLADSLIAQTVTNNVLTVNSPPVIVVNYQSSSYSGIVSEINASGSYDPNKENLTYAWVVPSSISVSSTSGPTIEYLGPNLDTPQELEITLEISDGKTTQEKIIPIEILPYRPELDVAEISNIYASDYVAPYFPHNIIDGNIGTMWAANGDDQWLIVKLRESFNVEHVRLAFQPGQTRESYFDILGSSDSLNWESILNKKASCAFSGDLQVFEFPPSKSGKDYNYIKLNGLGNSIDSWNFISELKIFGYKHKNPSGYEEQPVKIYPNPAQDYINIRIDEPTLLPDFIRIIDLLGKVVFQDKVNPYIKELIIPINLDQGVYIVQMGSGNVTLFTQKLIVGKNSL